MCLRTFVFGRCLTAGAALALVACGLAATAAAATATPHCANPKTAIGLARVVVLDTASGPLFGKVTRFKSQASFLRPKEVVLTFDDGPLPKTTLSVLATLKSHCTRAIFFPVGERAVRFAKTIRAIAADGHTIGSHTYSHPRNMGGMPPGKARDEIERGFAAIALAAGRPIAPFFRFTGLRDDRALLGYTQSRQLAVFSVDVVTDDSYAADTATLVRQTMARVKKNNGGILLFHDLKKVTARALPVILRLLKADGFKVVHVVPKQAFRRDPGYDSVFARKLGAVKRTAAAPPPKPNAVPETTASIADRQWAHRRQKMPRTVTYPVDPTLIALPHQVVQAKQSAFDPKGDAENARSGSTTRRAPAGDPSAQGKPAAQ